MGRLNSGEAAAGGDANASAGLATSRFGDSGIDVVVAVASCSLSAAAVAAFTLFGVVAGEEFWRCIQLSLVFV